MNLVHTMVSVIIPVYCHTEEHRAFLTETLQSVASQTYRDFELVIVDDVSPIDIIPLVEAIENLPRTRILRNVVNMGHAQSRNAGIRAAEGEMIAFLDHDDLWQPEKLERQVSAMQQNPDAAMVFCNAEIYGPHAQGLYIDQNTVPERPRPFWFMTHRNCVITVSAVLAKKQAMLDIGLFDSRYTSCDDFDAWIKLLMQAPIVHINETLVRYRLHAHNVNYGIDRVNDNKLLTKLMLKYWLAASLSEKIRLLPHIARKIAGRLYFTLARQNERKTL